MGAGGVTAIAALPAGSQPANDDVLYACYVPVSGTVYRIRTTDGPDSCRAGHIEFSWNAVGPQGAPGSPGISALEVVYSSDTHLDPGESGSADAVCSGGKRAISGGWLRGVHDPGEAVAAVRSSFGITGPTTPVPTVPAACH